MDSFYALQFLSLPYFSSERSFLSLPLTPLTGNEEKYVNSFSAGQLSCDQKSRNCLHKGLKISYGE